DNQDLFTFYDFPKSIRKSIYSTNLIESFNKKIKKYSKRKEQFPNEESLDRFLVTQFEEYNRRFATRCHIGFDQARPEITDMFNK
ncbi:transposase, partial [Oceanobacillus picturae]